MRLTITSQRAGRVVRQDMGYQAFIPEKLPPTPPLAFDAQLIAALSKADLALADEDTLASEQPKIEEVTNYVRAMNRGLERLRELPVSVRLLKELHSELMNGVRGSNKTPGDFR